MIVVKRGDIFFADLSPIKGSEQGGTRPVLVIQNNTGNKFSPTVIVAPITSKGNLKVALPTHCQLSDTCGLPQKSTVLLEQIRTIDKLRLQKFVGAVGAYNMKKVDEAIKISLGIV